MFTDKLSAPIPSTHEGVVKNVYYGEDDVIQVGDVILEIETEGDAVDAPEPDAAVPATPVEEVSKSVQGRQKKAKVLASPAVRSRAKTQGVDLS